MPDATRGRPSVWARCPTASWSKSKRFCWFGLECSRCRAASGPHHRGGDVAIDERCSDKIVLGDIFVGLMGDVERAGAKHDAHSAGVPEMHEVASARQSARL